MPRTTVFIVSDDVEVIEKAKAYFGPMGVSVGSYSGQQWREGLDSTFFRQQLVAGVPAAVNAGSEGRGNVLPFPGLSSAPGAAARGDGKVSTMNELESQAIKDAIVQFRGNLTEAAKALGIGRATLYRKVKQYQIDPSVARKKRAA
jgi:transcriptional regulator of acetoin/glycerol metabolism